MRFFFYKSSYKKMKDSALKMNVRIYGLAIQEDKILVSRERYGSHEFVKFPGGGLEYGEGTRECLQREFVEETGWNIRVDKHFYTTDFFQKSMFDESQVLSIYYFITLLDEVTLPVEIGNAKLFWIPIQELREALSLPIDIKVAALLESLES